MSRTASSQILSPLHPKLPLFSAGGAVVQCSALVQVLSFYSSPSLRWLPPPGHRSSLNLLWKEAASGHFPSVGLKMGAPYFQLNLFPHASKRIARSSRRVAGLFLMQHSGCYYLISQTTHLMPLGTGVSRQSQIT